MTSGHSLKRKLYKSPKTFFPANLTNSKKWNLTHAEGPRDASCQLTSCQLPRNSAETTYTTSPDQIDGMKLEI